MWRKIVMGNIFLFYIKSFGDPYKTCLTNICSIFQEYFEVTFFSNNDLLVLLLKVTDLIFIKVNELLCFVYFWFNSIHHSSFLFLINIRLLIFENMETFGELLFRSFFVHQSLLKTHSIFFFKVIMILSSWFKQ